MGVPDSAASALADVLLLRVAGLLAARAPLATQPRRSSRSKLNVWQDIKHVINDDRLELECATPEAWAAPAPVSAVVVTAFLVRCHIVLSILCAG